MKTQIVNILSDIFECEPADVEQAADFRDCGEWDSMAYLSAVAAIDDDLGVVITEADFANIKTVDDFVRVIQAKQEK